MASIKKLVRVFMADEAKHGFMVDESTTATQLVDIISSKIGLKDSAHFALFETKEGEERCLRADEQPIAISEKWSSSAKSSNESTEPRFVFKKKIFLREEEDLAKDEVAKHMLYIQSLYNVIEGEYPCSIEDALNLAGLQTLIIYGDHNPATHVVGFFGPNLKNFIPKPLMQTKSAKEWESLIFKNHAKRAGLEAEEAKSEYLNIVRGWPYYGTTYFKGCRTGTKSKTLPPKLVLGVSIEGIVLVNNKDKQQTISVHPFTDLLSWSVSPDTFAFEFGSPNEPTKYTFVTAHAYVIDDLVQSYVDVLLQMIKTDICNETSSPRE